MMRSGTNFDTRMNMLSHSAYIARAREIPWTAALRLAVFLTLALALLNPPLPWGRRSVLVVYVVDKSRSFSRFKGHIAAAIKADAGDLASSDSVCILAFDGGIRRIFGPAPAGEVAGIGAVDFNGPGEATNIRDALTYAGGIAGGAESRRAVLFTDGLDTVSSREGIFETAAGLGFPLDIVSFADRARDTSVAITGLPVAVSGKAEISFNLVVRGPPGKVRYSVLRDGNAISSGEITVPAWGTAVRTIIDTVDGGPDNIKYFARIEANDVFPENDRFRAIVLGGVNIPRVLVVSRNGTDSAVAKFLVSSGFAADIGNGEDLSQQVLVNYAAVVIDNYPALKMRGRPEEAIAAFVKESGGGLLMSGVEGSFALGGYEDTGIEELLPVFCNAEPEKRKKAAIAVCIDRSGSMDNSTGAGRKIDLAVDAVKAAVLPRVNLEEGDLLGIYSFAEDSRTDLAMDDVRRKEEIAGLLENLRPHGETFIGDCLGLAIDAIESAGEDFEHKLLLVITDGKVSDDKSFLAGIAAGIDEDVSILVAAVGDDPDWDKLKTLSEEAEQVSPGNLAKFLDEWILADINSDAVNPEGVRLRFTDDKLAEAAGELERTGAFISTALKDDAVLWAAVAGSEEPAVAMRSAGLGRAAAITFDLAGTAALDNGHASGTANLFYHVLNVIARRAADTDYNVVLEHGTEGIRVQVQAFNSTGEPVNELRFTGLFSGMKADCSFKQTAPGVYRSEWVEIDAGDYVFTLREARGGTAISVPAPVNYSKEFSRVAVDGRFLEELAATTGGTYTNDGIVPALAESTRGSRKSRGLFLVLALAVITIELGTTAFRRLRGR